MIAYTDRSSKFSPFVEPTATTGAPISVDLDLIVCNFVKKAYMRRLIWTFIYPVSPSSSRAPRAGLAGQPGCDLQKRDATFISQRGRKMNLKVSSKRSKR